MQALNGRPLTLRANPSFRLTSLNQMRKTLVENYEQLPIIPAGSHPKPPKTKACSSLRGALRPNQQA